MIRTKKTMLVCTVIMVAGSASLHGQDCSSDSTDRNVCGKISRNVYRIPYANSMSINIGGNHYVTHGGSIDSVATERVCTLAAATMCSSNSGCTSVGGTCQDGYCIRPCTADPQCAPNGGTCDYVLVAPADGVVCSIVQHHNDCGCNLVFGNMGNNVAILHKNDEMTRFLHIKQWSAALFGITPGMAIERGQPFAIEGDVGRTCGNTSPPRTGTCLSETTMPTKACEKSFPFLECKTNDDCTGVCTGTTCDGGSRDGQACQDQADCDDKCLSTDCGRHIHWNVVRIATGELMNPLTCGIPDNIYQAQSSDLAPCSDQAAAYPSNDMVASTQVSGFGAFRVVQAHNTISAGNTTVADHGSLVLHAGNRVDIGPGFRVSSPGYLRAEIGSPDVTAASDRPMPSACPCTEAVGFCFHWSDPFASDGVAMGCSMPGPELSKCHGCPSISGGVNCCPCIMNGDCQP